MAKSIVKEKAMSKWTATCLAVFALLVFVSVTSGFMFDSESGQKHMGPVTVRRSYGDNFEFIRPNGEFFETRFTPGWNTPNLHTGDVLKDIVYVDGKNAESTFVKGVLDHEATVQPTADALLYASPNNVSYACYSNGPCQVEQAPGQKFYRWKDGGYREKPEGK